MKAEPEYKNRPQGNFGYGKAERDQRIEKPAKRPNPSDQDSERHTRRDTEPERYDRALNVSATRQ